MNLDPEQVLNIFAKNVDTSYTGAIPNSLLSRQDLESEIVKLTNRNTPLRDMVKRTRGEGRAHLWNQRVALGHLPNNNSPLEIFYKDGALPTQSDPQYVLFVHQAAVRLLSKLRKFGEHLAEICETIPSQALAF
jgi:hypothetical protein